MATATQAATSTQGGENFAALFEESLARQEMRQGELITAEVIRVDYNIVVVNAGLKSESFIPIEEFKDDKGEVEVKAGDFVTVAIESLENGYGETRLSRDKAKRLKAWHDLEASMEQGSVVQGLVTSKVKGFVRSAKMICAGDLAAAVDGKVREILSAAAKRAQANKRSTVRPQDL